MKTASPFAFTVLLATILLRPTLAQMTIATPDTPFWGQFDSARSQAWGQTFVVPDLTHTQLDRLELRVASWGSDAPLAFTAYIAQWNPTSQHLGGAPLWSSSLQSAAGLADRTAGGSTLSFDTGGIDLSAGETYVLVAMPAGSVSGAPYQVTGLGYTYLGAYTGGNFVYSASLSGAPASYATLLSAVFYDNPPYDLAFGATFSEPGSLAVPESATSAAVLGLALCAGLVAFRARQQRLASRRAAAGPLSAQS